MSHTVLMVALVAVAVLIAAAAGVVAWMHSTPLTGCDQCDGLDDRCRCKAPRRPL